MQSSINDDYCDCLDGSDENRTSACSGIEDTSQTFACKIGNDVESVIPRSRVRDGICDCCDGSDEDAIICDNTCTDVRQYQATLLQKERSNIARGILRHWEFEQKGRDFKLEWTEQYVTKMVEAARYNIILNTPSRLRCMDEEEREKLKKLNSILDHYKINDKKDNVKNSTIGDEVAFRWGAATIEPQSVMEEELNEMIEEKLDSLKMQPIVSLPDVDEHDCNVMISIDDKRKVKRLLPQRISQNNEDLVYEENPEFEKLKGMVDDARTAAGNRLDEAIFLLKRMRVFEHSDDIFKGAFGTFLISSVINNQIYRIKLFEYATQSAADDSSSYINLGHFQQVSKENSEFQLQYKYGDKCPNGVRRELDVTVTCDFKEKIISIAEPDKCKYIAHVSSPAVCNDVRIHDINRLLGEENRPLWYYVGILGMSEEYLKFCFSKFADNWSHFRRKFKATQKTEISSPETAYMIHKSQSMKAIPSFVIRIFLMSIILTIISTAILLAFLLFLDDRGPYNPYVEKKYS